MAIQDIVNSIEQDTKEKIAQIQKDGQASLHELRQKLDQELAERKQVAVSEFSKAAAKKISQAGWKSTSNIQTTVLEKKRAMLDQLFSKVIDNMGQLSDDVYENLTSDLLNKLPDLDTETIIVPAQGKEDLTKKAIHKSGISAALSEKTVNSKGGFIVQSKDVNINLTFEALVELYRIDHETEIANKLFT